MYTKKRYKQFKYMQDQNNNPVINQNGITIKKSQDLNDNKNQATAPIVGVSNTQLTDEKKLMLPINSTDQLHKRADEILVFLSNVHFQDPRRKSILGYIESHPGLKKLMIQKMERLSRIDFN